MYASDRMKGSSGSESETILPEPTWVDWLLRLRKVLHDQEVRLIHEIINQKCSATAAVPSEHYHRRRPPVLADRTKENPFQEGKEAGVLSSALAESHE